MRRKIPDPNLCSYLAIRERLGLDIAQNGGQDVNLRFGTLKRLFFGQFECKIVIFFGVHISA